MSSEYLKQLPAEEFKQRLSRARELLAETGQEAVVLFDSSSIEYVTGFNHVQTERPVILALDQEEVHITVPRLEVERVSRNKFIDNVHSYFDYPQGQPMKTASQMIEELGAEEVLADSEGAPGTMGYSGPDLTEFKQLETQDFVSEWRKQKSDAEIALIQESAKWGKRGHEIMEELVEPGRYAMTVSQEASMKASREMVEDHGEEYAERTRFDGPVMAGIISGEKTRLPHAHNSSQKIQTGDTLISGAAANVDGYFSELERTMFVKQASDRQKQRFRQMVEAQDTAIEACGPGVPLKQVAEEVYSYYQEQGILDYLQHHVGHSIGMDGHEPPFIDRGSKQEMKPGQVYTLEPGIYTENAGYRHSDTVLITEDGAELVTEHPRDLEYNILR
ncbi:MAG: M24 family metallopeptidase [Candidatus Nanohaloarchaea archaeon]